MAAQTVKAFVADCYQLISSSSPTVPLHGNDISKGIQIMNELISSYSGTGLMLTIAKEITYVLSIGQREVTFADPDYVPTADVPLGRLANMQNAWLVLDGVTYPLIDESRNVFFASYKYDPQVGLPRFTIIKNELDITRMRVYPAASQLYELHVYGKFELSYVTEDMTMDFLPAYYRRFLRFAVTKDLSVYKSRNDAWDAKLEQMYLDAKKDMESVSSVNLTIETNHDSYLNGAWRVRAGI